MDPSDENNKTPEETNVVSEDHLLLARLLERQRPQAALRQVDEVLASDVPIHEKLERIEAIDRRFETDGRGSADATARAAGSASRGTRSSTSQSGPEGALGVESLLGLPVYAPVSREERMEVHRRRVSIKQIPPVNGFFVYFFRQARRVREFGRRTGLLTLGVFSRRPRFATGVSARYRSFARGEVRAVLAALQPILDEGWLVLTKAEYNLVGVFAGLCETLVTHGFPIPTGSNPSVFNRYASVERDILLLRRVDPDGSRVLSAVDRFYTDRKSVQSPDTGRVAVTVRTIIDDDSNPHGIAALVRALNIVTSGRYVELDMVTNTTVDDLLPSGYFDCDAETGRRIEEYLHRQIERIPLLTVRVRELSRIEMFARMNDESEDPYATLWSFVGDEKEKNFVVRILRMAAAVRDRVGPLLNGSILTDAGSTVSVFEDECFNDELSRIHLVVRQLEKLQYENPNFPDEKYFKIHRKNEQSTTLERNVVEQIESFAHQMILIGSKLSRFAGNRRDNLESAEVVSMPFSRVTFARPFVSPDVVLVLGEEGPIKGMTILDALLLTVQVSFLAARYLEERSVIHDLREVVALRRELESVMTTVDRIATRDVVEAVRSTWQLSTLASGAR